jgi:hypothetical protein
MYFQDARAFANHIREREHEYGAEPDDIEERQAALRERYAQEIEETGYDPFKDFSPTNTAYQEVLTAIGDEFVKFLPEAVREEFLERFYFSTIDNRHLKANIRRSNDGRFYAVFVNSILVTAMTRLFKLELAIKNPEQVHSCSRHPGAKLTSKQFREIYQEVLAHFHETKLPLGPQVLLEEPLNSAHVIMLGVKERLIVFHEIGHFLNGDLEDNCEEKELLSPYPNLCYQREHLADLIGFGLLLRQFKVEGKLTMLNRYQALLAVVDLQQLQHIIQGIETEKYPHPLNRMSHVIAYFFGDKMEEMVAECILNGKSDNLAIYNFNPDLTREGPILGYIEELLRSAFNKAREN